jgi:hypothetical protein
MSQSTPINLIRRGESTASSPMDNSMMMDTNFGGQHSDSQLVEDILKEMGDSPGIEQQSNINSQALQYAMDSSQVPAYKHNQQQYEPSSPYDNYAEKMMYQEQNKPGFFGQIGINLNGESIKHKFMKNIKYPCIVFVLCFLISLPEFNRFLFGFFPKLLLESGQVSIGGVFLKAFVGMLLFAITALFL